MATRMNISYLCDKCGNETDLEEEIFTYAVEIPNVLSNKKKPTRMVMDLCPQCAGDFESAYDNAWRRESGSLKDPIRVTVKEEVDAFGPPICKECGFVAKSFSGLGVHTVRKHGK